MKKILFPTDFSESSANAYKYALQLANNTNAEVVALHVYEMPVIDYVNTPAYLLDVYNTVELASFENYKSHVPELKRLAAGFGLENVPVSSVLLEGDLVQTILEMVKEQHFDFIVMGTKGATGMKETFFGTSTASVMTDTDAIVLAVPDESTYKNIEKIVFTTRFREKDVPALKKLLTFADAFGAQVDCLYIKTQSSDLKEVVLADWRHVFRDYKLTFHIIDSEDIEGSILEFLDSHQIDLLALLNHKRGFFENLFKTSLTKKLAFHSKIPILAFH
ncbi:universal stress protein [Flavobacterium silvaticum]|uniref:Universal stress protein n=1 Tax=Flavobacterium silvaticum TaxID=1852020 RepID=A0A972FXY4_9FLAO|nr:universal stress protein [Flavobacterium silvaticum]NMH26886.1 universal stress protein [Flavobacterium silvaticum]